MDEDELALLLQHLQIIENKVQKGKLNMRIIIETSMTDKEKMVYDVSVAGESVFCSDCSLETLEEVFGTIAKGLRK